jgi:hypothetical protein
LEYDIISKVYKETDIRNIIAGDQNFIVVGSILRHSKGIMKAMRSSASEKDNIYLNRSEK